MTGPVSNRLRAAFACAALLLLALGAASCAVKPAGSAKGGARLVVTRDFGQRKILTAAEDPIPSGETVMRFLMRRANIETRYGGRFVNAISGVRSSTSGAERRDWFYYVNGIEADKGASDRDLAGGDRVWWDYHDWSSAMRVPAVVGSFPEPFLHGTEGKRFPVRIDCAQGASSACGAVADRLDAAGIAPSTSGIGAPAGKAVLRLVVGKWSDARQDGAAEQLEQGPDASGVFAKPGPAGSGAYELDLLDAHGRVVRTLGPGGGLVAATRFEDQQPTWVVTGTDDAGLRNAVSLLDRATLADRFAVATDGRTPLALPLAPGR